MILKLMTVFNNTAYQQWFRKIAAWVSNAQSVYRASVTTVTTNSQDDWRTVHCYEYLHVKNPQTETVSDYYCSPTHIEKGQH